MIFKFLWISKFEIRFCNSSTFRNTMNSPKVSPWGSYRTWCSPNRKFGLPPRMAVCKRAQDVSESLSCWALAKLRGLQCKALRCVALLKAKRSPSKGSLRKLKFENGKLKVIFHLPVLNFQFKTPLISAI